MSYEPHIWTVDETVTAARLNAIEQAIGEDNMEYTPNVWETGDVITVDKMNHIEEGIANGGGVKYATITLTHDFSNIGNNEGGSIEIELYHAIRLIINNTQYISDQFVGEEDIISDTIVVPLLNGQRSFLHTIIYGNYFGASDASEPVYVNAQYSTNAQESAIDISGLISYNEEFDALEVTGDGEMTMHWGYPGDSGDVPR